MTDLVVFAIEDDLETREDGGQAAGRSQALLGCKAVEEPCLGNFKRKICYK